ncbi:MAG: phenylacetate--CoA ligase [Desulfohalobiaceae bacterium]|nr:phenylacetate--CoA ligase [Desulfohalobiaceae bacterium]
MSFMPEATTEEELQAQQLEGLQWTVNHAYHGSPAYKAKLDAAGVTPEQIKQLDDLRRLPFTTAADLKEGYPFPLLCVPFKDVVRIHASSGTTGKRKVLCYTQHDIQDWAHFFARCYEMAGLSAEDRVQIAVGYGVWTAGVGFQAGCERFGAMAVPVGPGNLEMQTQFLLDFQSTVLCCTASMGLLLAEEVSRNRISDQLNLKKMIFGSERSSQAMRRKIQELLGLEQLFDIPGMTELYGPGTGLECSEHAGIHYWADYFLLEIVDPETLEPVQPGEVGEMVVTSLKKEAVPLIRYRTRDLSRLIPGRCACDSLLPRHDQLLGRTDDMIIFRAVNIYPGQIDEILSQIKGIGSEFQIVLEREQGLDSMLLRIEREQGQDADIDEKLIPEITQKIKSQILVASDIELVDYGSLTRTVRKTKRVIDKREGN